MFKEINKILPLFVCISFIFINGCSENFPQKEKINGNYTLINQDSSKVVFPDDFKGEIVVIGFIFTNCPDICPMTTHNMQLVQEKINQDEIQGVEFIGLSFDPTRDTPEVLTKYAEIREIDMSNFQFLTGKVDTIEVLLKEMNVLAISGDTTYTEIGNANYFYTHTDRITLIDQEGNIRKEFSGSRLNKEVLIEDIKRLED